MFKINLEHICDKIPENENISIMQKDNDWQLVQVFSDVAIEIKVNAIFFCPFCGVYFPKPDEILDVRYSKENIKISNN